MYLFLGFFLLLCIFLYVLGFWRSRRIIRKICEMSCCDKLYLLNELLRPFGFSYNEQQDIITSLPTAWQREFGYRAVFDRTASRFNMVFDCEPVYFDYDGRTWLIEFWKGQYGINIGGEIGIYRADSVLSPKEYRRAHFKSASDDQMLPLSMELFCKNHPLFTLHRLHWWLTGFKMGEYSNPEDLILNVSLTFPNREMFESFLESLQRLGYSEPEACVCNLTVSFSFQTPHSRLRRGLRARFSQFKNRLFIRIYRRITRPFVCTPDRLLYLYYLLPFAFRRMIRCRKNRKQKLPRDCKKCRRRK